MNEKKTPSGFTRRQFIRNSSLLTAAAWLPLEPWSFWWNTNRNDGTETLFVRKEGNNIVLECPLFAFGLNLENGLRAEWWENRLTGRKLQLGKGNEIEFTIGLPFNPVTTPVLCLRKEPAPGEQPNKEVVFELASEDPAATVLVSYHWDGTEPVLTKRVLITNEGGTTWDRLMDINLGTYLTDAAIYKDEDWPVLLTRRPWINAEPDFWDDPAGTVRGFPAYLEDQFFLGMAHPSGFSLTDGQQTALHHHPGIKVAPGESFTSFQAIYGVANREMARSDFRKFIHSRMRRVRRGHDHSYAIIDTCGSQNNTKEDNFGVTEEWSLAHISKLAGAQKETGMHFDNYVIEFWHDSKGDLKECDPIRFPDNFDKIQPKLAELGVHLGLWISSGQNPYGPNMDNWTIGDNPVLYPTSTDGNGKGRICRSTEPANKLYIDGLIYQIRNNHIRQVKLDVAADVNHDSYFPWCNNPKHRHLAGDLYSVEANHNAQIELLNALDKECPEIFLTLYWGHYSPWWLLHADTVFDAGARMEMASHSLQPTLFARSSNIRRLDQAKWMAKDIPDLGWDSLGISLSDWAWNNRLGSAGWQEAVLMDICRGSLLLHIWSDNDGIPAAGRPQMAEFISLLKARPECFQKPFKIGNPFKDDYWGYCCTDGSKAMIGLHNGSWKDQRVVLELNDKWGLNNGGQWDIYCWYPDHTRFRAPGQETTGREPFGALASVIMRPFTALLLEIVPRGQRPALDREWRDEPIPATFQQTSREISITTVSDRSAENRSFSLSGTLPPTGVKSWLAISMEYKKNGYPFWSLNNKPHSSDGALDGKTTLFEAALDNPWYPAPWQTYRLAIDKSPVNRDFQFSCSIDLPEDVAVEISGYIIPV